MKKSISLLLAVIMMGVFSQSVFGAENATSELQKEISNILESAESGNGISVAISNGFDTLYQNSMGYENKESGIQVSEQTVFEWGSTTKLLVWVSVMQLVEKGQLDLNTSIQQYLPDNFLKNLSYEDQITMLNLMNHTAGFQETYIGLYVNQDVEDTLENALKRNQPDQIYKPGEHLAYSNWGAALAGYIVERVSGQPFWEYVHQNIFNPLEMKHTALKADFSDNDYVKQCRTQLKGYDIDGNELPKSGYLWLYPAGGSAGTMEDFCKFSKALATKDSRLFSNSNMYEELYSSSLNYSDTQTSRIRHGFLTFKQGDLVIGHGGYALNGTTYIVFNPDTEQVLTVMTNEAT
jgi:CubicO group peptidase (beta-lactamase class C family)